jgi:tetratricopeptide (TPR) repeat protein
VFAGDWTLEAAEAVCADGDIVLVEDVLDLFVGLVRKSLVVATEAADGIERYRLLETVREHAWHKLATRGVAEATAIRERHAVFYSADLERLYPGMWRYGTVVWTAAGQPADALREQIEQMHDNLRAALGWWMAERRATEGLQLAITLCQFWISRGAYAETSPWLEPMRDLATGPSDAADHAAEEVPVAVRARALSVVGTLAAYRGQYAKAVTFLQECVALARQVDDGSHLARCLALLARSLWLTGAEDRATEPLEESLRLGREVGDPRALAMILRNLAEIAHWQGQHELASVRLRECLDLVGWPAKKSRGQMLPGALALLGRSAYLAGASQRARTHLYQALEAIRESRLTGRRLAESLEWLAALEGAEGQLIRAARLFGAAEAWWLACGSVRNAPEQQAYEHDVAGVRAELERTALAKAAAEGRAMTLDQILGYALEGVAVAHTPPRAHP